MIGEDKNAVIFEQYDLDINKIYRVKGAVVLDCSDGEKVMREYRYSEGKAVLVNFIMEHLRKSGFEGVDLICQNKNGRLISENQYGNRYVIRDYYPGLECDLKTPQDVINAVAYLAKIHTILKNVDLSFFDNRDKDNEIEASFLDDTECSRGNEDKKNEDMINKEEKNKFMGCSKSSESDISNRENNYEENPDGTSNSADGQNDKVEDARIIVPRKNIREYLFSHMREIRRVRKYIGDKKRKNDFEVQFINSSGVFKEQPEKALECLGGVEYEKLFEETMRNQSIMHGEFTQHNIIFYGENGCAITGFEKAAVGVQIYDLYRLLRKVMEKNMWDYEYGKCVIDRYIVERRRLGNEVRQSEINVLFALLIFPEKLWKIVDYYYNKRKSWMSARMSEKLNKLVQQEGSRQEFITKFNKDYV